MRVAIVSVPREQKPPGDYVTALSKGVESMGHRVEIIDAYTEDGRRLPAFEYIIVAAEQTGIFRGKMPDALTRFLRGAMSLSGKKSAAFLRKTSPFTGKAMANLMRTMEQEGMFVNWSEIILSAPQAQELGKRILS
ncbi:MAG: hypothetical protein LBK61_00255 [Spirochaetaceae bacterium]|jgi:menaquinone-dependent protoporphyrinogen IX oxidase|nr:hypothetical protein [Spirochaetaceae bacterium]